MFRSFRLIRDGILVVALLGLALLIAARLEQAGDAVLRGPFHAIDGDTLAAGEERLRLAGIDAPELDQECQAERGEPWPCGQEAKRLLARLVSADGVECRGGDRDRYRRLLVRCQAGPQDINAVMVERGLAVDGGPFRAEQAAARRDGLGLWAGTFEQPRDWRARRGMMDDPGMLAAVTDWLKGLLAWE